MLYLPDPESSGSGKELYSLLELRFCQLYLEKLQLRKTTDFGRLSFITLLSYGSLLTHSYIYIYIFIMVPLLLSLLTLVS